jgi:hypothetical protein
MARTKTKQIVSKHKQLDLYPHQLEVDAAYKTGHYDRFYLAWHRRAGKDVYGLDFARRRMEERTGTYWHLFPFHVQARRAIWKGIDARDGLKFIDRAFPPQLRDGINETEMSIDWKGSHWQMLGSDNYDRMVGSNPCGIVFSEWALCDPAAWEYIRPILIENKGWAMFITTFRGRNHAHRMFETVKELDNWYASLRTIRDTFKHDGKPIVSEADVDIERRAGMDESLIQQEFYCNPDAASSGAIFNRQYNRILIEAPHAYLPSNKILRVAWGIQDEGVAAVVYQDKQIIAVHTFAEWNLIDAIQCIARRHPNAPTAHYSEIEDPSLFSDIDGYGFHSVKLSKDEAVKNALAAQILNTASYTAIAKERLGDFSMAYAPYRSSNDDDINVYPAIARALAVMRMTQPVITPRRVVSPLKYAGDRGVI